MRLPRVQFTLRWTMIGVAVVALSIAAEQSRQRMVYWRQRAEFHSIRENIFRREAARLPLTRSERELMCGTMVRAIMLYPRLAAYHAELRRKYEYAARYPWLSVEPDPPKPE
jgi:hypothetical protein